MSRHLKMEVFYPYSPQRVWQVLTNRRALAAWLMENDFEPRVGHKFRFKDSTLPGLDESVDCQVIELEEPKRLSYTWQDRMMSQPSIVTWTLKPVHGGTQLQLEHKQLRQEAIKPNEPIRLSQPWQSQFMYESRAIHQIAPGLALATRNTSVQSLPVGKYELLNSILLHYFLNGGWEYKLNEKLSQILFATDQITD
jgi:uncharacterized protein YndB with AHSA1/START domain